MYESIKHALETLKKSGYRAIIFAPNVIEGVDKEVLDNALVEAYWGVLEDIGKDVEEAQRLEVEATKFLLQ